MNLHGIARGAIGAVNPFVPATLQICVDYTTDRAGKRMPVYATPLDFTGAIFGTELVVAQIFGGGPVMVGMTINGPGVIPGTVVTGFLTGNGHTGTYSVAPDQLVFEGSTIPGGVGPIPNDFLLQMNASFVVQAQVQPLSYKDIVQLDALNIGGYRRAIYINGQLDALVREDKKGGDLVILQDGTVWLVAIVLEQWPDWVKVAATLQNGRSSMSVPNSPLSQP